MGEDYLSQHAELIKAFTEAIEKYSPPNDPEKPDKAKWMATGFVRDMVFQRENEETWRGAKQTLGEDAAKAKVVRQLRTCADHIEKDVYPKIYSCRLMADDDKPCSKEFIESLWLTLSNPWPG